MARNIEHLTDPQLMRLSNNPEDESIYNDIDLDAFMENDEDEDENPVQFSDDNFSDHDLEIKDAFNDEESDSYEDEDEDDFMDAIREANNFKVKKRKTKARFSSVRPNTEMDPEVRMLLSEGNIFFVNRDYESAEKAYLEVIKKDPKNFPAYKSLGEVYALQGKENKSCNAWFLAAHIKPLDGEFWAFVADSSKGLGHTTQALYCYGRAISAGHRPFEVMLDRAVLYIESGQLGRASESLQKLHELEPTRPEVLKELALIYSKLNRVNDAIGLYLKNFELNERYRKRAYETADDSDEDESVSSKKFAIFEWSSLNILAELFVHQRNYGIAIKTIKHIARWIQEREDETFWDDSIDDSEFDERRYENAKFEALPDVLKTKSHKLPIDIRVKLGVLRLNLNDIDDALIHFGFLLNDDVVETTDLFQEAATKLEDSQLFNEAVKFYLPLSKLNEFHTPEIFSSLARCYTEIGRYQEAKDNYNSALHLDPGNVDVKLALVEVLYYLEEIEESQALLEKIKQSKSTESGNSLTELSPKNDLLHQGIIENTVIKPLKRGSRLTQTEREAREGRIKQNVIEKYNRLQRLRQGRDAGDLVATGAWIRLASELIEIFSNVKNFFPKDRSIKFKGIVTRTKGLPTDFESKIDRISDLYAGFTSKVEERIVLSSKEELKGLKYEQWFDLFMEYSLAVAKYESPEDASSIIDNAKNVNVFYHDKAREKIMNLVKLAISVKSQNQRETLLSLRYVLNFNQFNKKLLRMFLLVHASGKFAIENFISINHQKYFLRQIKGYDSVKLNKTIPGMATIANKTLDFEGHNNIYLMYIYACLLFTNRSYVPSLVYFTRIYKTEKEEPIVCFLTGLAHVHRAMQRSSSNRHLEILQGMKYLMEYYDLRTSDKFGRYEQQEAIYNLGRVYHLLGLFSTAVTFYNKVLEEFTDLDDEVDFKKQAAYNLILIYNNSGNTRLSNRIMETYLTV